MNASDFVKAQAENGLKAAVLGYAVEWQSKGLDFAHLFTLDNGKAAVVAVALMVATGFGLRKFGKSDSPNVNG